MSYIAVIDLDSPERLPSRAESHVRATCNRFVVGTALNHSRRSGRPLYSALHQCSEESTSGFQLIADLYPEMPSMHRTLSVLTLTIIVTWIPRCSIAAERGFEFSGSVDFVFQGNPPSNPFGLPIDDDTLVIGRFVYETTSPATHDLPGDATGYRQQHTNGFWAEFDGVRVQADDYTIEIANDVNNTNSVNDVVTIRFSSDLNPPPELPLLVNGMPETVGQFSIAFFASSDLYSDTSLPSDLDPAMFSLPLFANLLSDQPLPASRLALFTLESFAPINLFSSDHDLDDDVDGRDFLIWQRNFGQTVQNGDANSDYQVDDVDLGAWQDQYGSIGAISQVKIVPEPSAGVVLGISLLVLYGFVIPLKRHLLGHLSRLPNRLETTQFNSTGQL